MLTGKNVIVTGARRGIGFSTVASLAKKGANVWACARHCDESFEAEMKKLSDKYNVSIWPVYFDLKNENEIKAAIQVIRKMKLSIDALVNVAGVADESTSFLMTPIDKIKDTFEINFFSTTCLTQYIARLMARQMSGSIVNIVSVAGIDGTPGQYEYVSSKAALIGATKSLARELSMYNIRVNAVAPGIIDTDMGAQIAPELKEKTLNNVIMGRDGHPEEIADVITFLASDMSSFITGQVIRVDGGM